MSLFEKRLIKLMIKLICHIWMFSERLKNKALDLEHYDKPDCYKWEIETEYKKGEL